MAKPATPRVTIRNNNYYRAQLRAPNGKRVSVYGKTTDELKEKVQAVRESFSAMKNDTGVTFSEYATRQLSFIKERVAPGTYAGYDEKVRLRMLPLLGNKPIADITPDDIQRVLVGVIPFSQSYYHDVHMLLRRIFAAAKKSRVIQDDPTEGIPASGGKPTVQKPALSDGEAEQLLSAVHGLPVETFCRIGIYAGLRREEILALRWEFVHLDCDTPYIEVKNAWRLKNNRPEITPKLKSPAAERKVPIPPQLANHLRENKSHTTSAYVVCNRDGDPLSGTQWRHLWRQVERRSTAPHNYVRYKNGVKEVHTVTPQLGARAAHNPSVVYTLPFHVTPHQLRYTYVTNLIHKGMDPKTVQYLAGHKSIKITLDIYARLKYHQPADLAEPITKAFEHHEKGSDGKS